MSKELEQLEIIKNSIKNAYHSEHYREEELTIIEKSLKVLEIIKENLVVGYDESKKDIPCLTLGIKVGKDKIVIIYQTFDKEKIDLLKEVLL